MQYTTSKLMADRQLYPFQQMLRNTPNQPNLARNLKKNILKFQKHYFPTSNTNLTLKVYYMQNIPFQWLNLRLLLIFIFTKCMIIFTKCMIKELCSSLSNLINFVDLNPASPTIMRSSNFLSRPWLSLSLTMTPVGLHNTHTPVTSHHCQTVNPPSCSYWHEPPTHNPCTMQTQSE